MENRFSIALRYVRTHVRYAGKIGMSLRDLARQAGLSAPYISQLESAKQARIPGSEAFSKISSGLSKQTSLNKEDLVIFFKSMAGIMLPDPKNGLSVASKLANTNFGDFLQIVMGYVGTVRLDDDPNNLAKQASADWTQQQLLANEELIKDYQAMSHRLFLSLLDSSAPDVILDNEMLSTSELVILKGAVSVIRELRDRKRT